MKYASNAMATATTMSSVRCRLPVRSMNSISEILFDPANPSFHPVETQGKNPDVPSLLPPYTATSIISCTDCHGNSDTLGPPGPHGSDYQYLLTDSYITDDNTPESPSSYALCYQCHSRSVVVSSIKLRAPETCRGSKSAMFSLP